MRIDIRSSKSSEMSSALGPTSRHSVFFTLMPLLLAIALVWPLTGGRKVVMTASPSVPAAKGTVYMSHDRNKNSAIDMKVEHLAHPSALTPPQSAYVVWIQESGHDAENQGELHIGNDLNGEFKTVSPHKQFSVFVTAEQGPQVHSPTGDALLTAQVAE
jgi:hypothetical protein